MDRWAEEDSDEEESINKAKVIFDKEFLALLKAKLIKFLNQIHA